MTVVVRIAIQYSEGMLSAFNHVPARVCRIHCALAQKAVWVGSRQQFDGRFEQCRIWRRLQEITETPRGPKLLMRHGLRFPDDGRMAGGRLALRTSLYRSPGVCNTLGLAAKVVGLIEGFQVRTFRKTKQNGTALPDMPYFGVGMEPVRSIAFNRVPANIRLMGDCKRCIGSCRRSRRLRYDWGPSPALLSPIH